MQVLAGRQVRSVELWRHRSASAKRNGSRRTASEEVVRTDRRGDGVLRPRGANGDDAVRRIVAPDVEHRAMMLAVATATDRQAGVGILREREQRRDQGKREGRKQQDGEQASHERSDGSSVRPRSQVVCADVSLGCSDSVRYGRIVV